MSTFYDILLDADGDLPITTQHVRGWLVVVQRVQFRLSTFKGEWILDTAAGLPYLEWRATKNPNRREIGARIQQEITSTNTYAVRIVSQPVVSNPPNQGNSNYGGNDDQNDDLF